MKINENEKSLTNYTKLDTSTVHSLFGIAINRRIELTKTLPVGFDIHVYIVYVYIKNNDEIYGYKYQMCGRELKHDI